jgi:serine/threonine protein kinase
MGDVMLARHHGLEGVDRLCIVKTLRADLASDAEYARRFIDEARVVFQLQHANVCSVFDVGRVDDELFLAMEYVQGINLRTLHQRLLKLERPLDPGLALYLLGELSSGLAYAHSARHPLTQEPLNIVHRDVSPQNAMLSYDGDVKVIDFGLAVSELKEEQTEDDSVLGKIAYMAPEQARGEALDGRSDQYALAILAFELFTQQRFYDDTPKLEIWTLAARGGYRPQHWDRLPTEVAPILERALRALPEDRWSSCDELRDALEEVRRDLWPQADKAALRALLHDIFADRLDETRAYLLSLHETGAASSSAPTPSTGSWSGARPTAPSSQSAATPGTISEREASFLDRAQAGGAAAASESSSASSRADVPKRSFTMPLLAGGGLGITALIAIAVLRGGAPSPPPTPPAIAPVPDVPRPPVDEPPPPVDSPVAPADDAPVVDEPDTPPPVGRGRRGRRGRSPAAAAALSAPVDEPAPPPLGESDFGPSDATPTLKPAPVIVPPTPTRKRTLEENIAVLRRCELPTAKRVYQMVLKQGGASRVSTQERPLIELWANKCLKR